ncbi:hypothetical protein MHU86_10735 [Fragilaria crotonensis]|nr:hypothetical protein MHU86_10735 [Fragilaria crotonensis]
MMKVAFLVLLYGGIANAFVHPASHLRSAAVLTQQTMMLDFGAIDVSTQSSIPALAETVSNLAHSSNLLAFADQGQNLAGIFFQASLLPYLTFLYFLGFRGNRIPDLGNFGFQFVLIFVMATIPSGIISKATYGTSLANVDWLHGGAELLLTVANIMLVLGFKEGASKNLTKTPVNVGRVVALGCAGLFAAACTLGPGLGFEAHSPFLFGIGDLSEEATLALPWVTHSEPINALSIPTWVIHFSSVLEFLVAMKLVWDFSEVTENETWKGLTWGMLPLHASGICACTYHFFYNPSDFQFLVTMQAAFTCLGNITCAIAAYRIAVSNGWTLSEVNPFPRSNTSPQGLIVDAIAATPLASVEAKESNVILAGKIAALTVLLSYLVKYGELGIDLPSHPMHQLRWQWSLAFPPLRLPRTFIMASGFKLPSLGGGDSGEGLSMADVKKYGVAGTLAYVLTELAFWAVAFLLRRLPCIRRLATGQMSFKIQPTELPSWDLSSLEPTWLVFWCLCVWGPPWHWRRGWTRLSLIEALVAPM